MDKRQIAAFLKEYEMEEKRYQDFQNRAMLKIVERQEGYDAKIQELIDTSDRLLETNRVLHTALEEALNELAARDLLELQEREAKKRNLSETLLAIQDNEAERARKPAFKAGAPQPTDDGFLGFGRDVSETELKDHEARLKDIKKRDEEKAAKG